MSTVILDTITGKSTATTITIGSTPIVSASANSMTIRGEGSNQTSIQQGLAKAWHLSTTAAVIEDSFNSSANADNGTGDYTYNISNNMASVNYSAPHITSQDADNMMHIHTRATGTIRVNNVNDGATARDAINAGTIHGDLA